MVDYFEVKGLDRGKYTTTLSLLCPRPIDSVEDYNAQKKSRDELQSSDWPEQRLVAKVFDLIIEDYERRERAISSFSVFGFEISVGKKKR